ncbi:cytochrome P450 [Aspergillus karnatakaensis]|uniref:cytochrome P450 n=1 Tax=Aspergillus karnatakaensis TaxID=1810916 RepID=UPI003CCCB681
MLFLSSIWSPLSWLIMSILYFIGRTLYNIYLHPLAKFPGPLAWSGTRLTWILSMSSGSHQVRIKALHDRYGPIVRVAPDELSFTDPMATPDIYSKEDRNNGLPKSEVLFGGQQYRHAFDNNGEEHALLRRKLSPLFTEQAVTNQEPLLQKYLALMTTNLRNASRAGQTVNIVEWLNWFSFDVVGELAFSESFNQLDRAQSHPWPTMITSHLRYSSLSVCLRFYPPLDRLFPLITPRSLHRLKWKFVSMARDKVQRRLSRADSKQLKDMLASFLPENNSNQEIMDMETLSGSFTFLIIAGSETLATTLAGLINLLCKHPDIMQQLTTELRTVPNVRDLTLSTTAAMPYLNAVLKEGLRSCHPVPGALARLVPPEGRTIAGHFVPGNTYVGIPFYAAYHSEANFPAADEFNPSRWLGEQPTATQETGAVSNSFYPFAMGGHGCIGQNLARAELRLVLAHLLYAFDLEAVGDVSWEDQNCYFLWQKSPFMVRLKDAMPLRDIDMA